MAETLEQKLILAVNQTGEDWRVEDILYEHFEKTSEHWTDASHEGRRLMSVMLGYEVESSSPVDCVVSAAAVGGWYAALKGVAKALGVDPNRLEIAISDHVEGHETEPIGFDGLRARHEQEAKDHAERVARRAAADAVSAPTDDQAGAM